MILQCGIILQNAQKAFKAVYLLNVLESIHIYIHHIHIYLLSFQKYSLLLGPQFIVHTIN